MLRRARSLLLGAPAWRRALYVDGALAGINSAVVGGTVLTGLVLWAGGGAFELGLLSALTTGGGLFVLAIHRVQQRLRTNRQLTTVTWTAAWAAWLPLAIVLGLIALLGGAGRVLAIPLLLITAFVSAALIGIGNISWSGWIGQLVPRAHRGGFIAQQARCLSLAALVALPIIGYLLDRAQVVRFEALVFALLAGVPALLALARWRLLGSVPETQAEQPAVGPRRLARAFELIPAGRMAAYTIIWQVSVYMAAPFFQAFSLDRLKMSFSELMYLQVLAQIIPVLTLGWWGGIVDRVGIRMPLALCTIGKALVPVCYLLATPTAWWPVIGAFALSVLDAGLTISINSAYTQLAEGRNGSARVAHISIITSLSASITPVVAGFLVSSVHIGSLDLFVVLFGCSAVGRAVSALPLILPRRHTYRDQLHQPRVVG